MSYLCRYWCFWDLPTHGCRNGRYSSHWYAFFYISAIFLIVDQYTGSDPPEAMGSHSLVIVVYGGLQLPVVAIPVAGDGFRYAGAEPLSDGVA